MLAFLCEDDVRTKHGRNLHQLLNELECDKLELSSSFIKQNMKFQDVPQNEKWRIPLLLNLKDVINNSMELKDFLDEEIDAMIEDIYIN